MTTPTIIGLVNNTALLLALGVIYGFLQHRAQTFAWKLASGFVLGFIAVGLMMNPWQLTSGVFFDSRSILLSVGGLFFGIVPMIPAMILSGLYRIHVGGAGTLTGVLWILGSGSLGLVWARLRKQPAYRFSTIEFYLFGVVIHACMLPLMLTMPDGMGLPILSQISLPVMLIFPLGTVLLAKLIANQERQQHSKLELAASEGKYRELVNNSQAIILSVDIQGRITFFNEFAQTFFGYRDDEIIGRSVFDTIIPAEESIKLELEAMFAAARETLGTPITHENDNICRDGRRVRILWKNSLVRNAAGAITGFQSIGHDLTEQRNAEASLLAAEQEFHQLINVSPVPLAILEHNHKFIFLNQRFTETFGYTLNDLATVDDWWVRCYPEPQYRQKVKQKWLHAVNIASEPEAKFTPQEARVTCKNGTVIDVVAKQSSIGNKEIVVFNNMSRERELDRLKSGFIATAAHELNTPLTSVLGFIELLLGDDDLDRATQKEYLTIVLDKTETLGKIVDDLLELSIAKDGRKVRVMKGPGDLRDLVTCTLDSYQKEFCDRQFPLAWPEPEAVKACFDRIKIRQVLENLLSNAIKFSPRGTPIRVGCTQTESEVRISVSNQGKGMTPEQADRAFERFYRADISNTAIAGLGLGLSIAKEIIEAHGGTIVIQSRPGEGAEASFVLPLAS